MSMAVKTEKNILLIPFVFVFTKIKTVDALSLKLIPKVINLINQTYSIHYVNVAHYNLHRGCN